MLKKLLIFVEDGKDDFAQRWLGEESYFLFLVVLGVEPRALHMLGKCSVTELHPSPQGGSIKTGIGTSVMGACCIGLDSVPTGHLGIYSQGAGWREGWWMEN
jgi:hypothetical protein